MTFDLQTIWTASGMSAAALLVGYIFGVAQSAIPGIPLSGTLRNWVLIALSAGIVGLAGYTSGATATPESVFGGFLVFLGIYNAAKNAHGAGEWTAVRSGTGDPITSPGTTFTS